MLCAKEQNRQYERLSRKKKDKEVRDTPYLKFLAMRSDWILADEDGEFSKKVIFVSHRLCWHSAFKSRLLTGTFPDLIKGPQFHYSTNVQSFAEL